MNPGESLSGAVSALQSAADTIRRIEEEAREALYLRDDPETYRQKLQEKTMLLMELSELADPFYGGMATDARTEIEAGLNSFERRAAQA